MVEVHCVLIIEEGGNDRYETRNAVAAGLAWDLSVAWFEDRGGNDRYPAQGFSLGASAHNSVAVFIDRGGNDRMIGAFAQATGQTNDFLGGTSLSLVLNLGRKPARPDFRDRHTIVLNAGRSIEQALDRVLGK